MKNKIVISAALMALAFAPRLAMAADAPACDRACLKGFVDGYFDALARNDASKLPVSANVKVTENGERVKLGEGVWKSAGKTGYRLELYDPEQGSAGVQAVVQEKEGPALYVVRLKIADRKITEAETIVARKGSYGALWSPENLKEVSPGFSMSIRTAEQNSRLELLAAADAYWRAFETNGSPDYHPAPLLPSTLRFENGVQTTNNKTRPNGPLSASEQFDRGLFKGGRITDRRYPVVDLERGVVMSIVRFGPREATATRAADLPLVMEAFAVEAGRIHEVQVVLISRPVGSPTGW
ncbi:MAG: hypothetical protein ABIO39_05850 [Caulobacteraceae bacterium]